MAHFMDLELGFTVFVVGVYAEPLLRQGCDRYVVRDTHAFKPCVSKNMALNSKSKPPFILTNHMDILEVTSSNMTNHRSPHLIGISIDPLRTAPFLDGGANYQTPTTPHCVISSLL